MKRILLTLFAIVLPICWACAQSGVAPYLKGKASNKWTLVWHDEFSDPSSIDKLWNAENASPGHILSSRWRSNLSVSHGKLKITNLKQNKGGKSWTSGSMSSKKAFRYGYFECRMKISKAEGINNSFWLYCTKPTSANGHKFEIDVIEGHYPDNVLSNIHNNGTKVKKANSQHSKPFKVKPNLYSSYHIFGLDWSQDSLKFYIDGMLVRSEKKTCCFDAAPVILGTAVMTWAGKVTNKNHGTNMLVDYVRVFNKN